MPSSPPVVRLLKAVDLDIVDHIDLPAREARHLPVPAPFDRTEIVRWVERMTGAPRLRRHQSLALEQIGAGCDVVVATGTASGKSLVFQLAAIDLLLRDCGKTLVFYPTKALVADQHEKWRQALVAADRSTGLVAEMTGDTPTCDRAKFLEQASIVLATPDVIHSWMMQHQATPTVGTFLSQLRLVVSDEAHAQEGGFGSSCAFLNRRLMAAKARFSPQGAASLQWIAATATVSNAAEHCQRLTGRPFVEITETDNGAPLAQRTLLHIEGPESGAAAERMVAELARSLAPVMDEESFIIFMDSRQGVERAAQLIGRDDCPSSEHLAQPAA